MMLLDSPRKMYCLYWLDIYMPEVVDAEVVATMLDTFKIWKPWI